MENNSENKGRFFAQYFGQKVQRWHQWILTTENNVVHMLTPMSSGLCNVDKGWFLELTLLSMISDDDAIQLSKIGLPDKLFDYLWNVETGKAMANSFKNNRQTNTFYTQFRVGDSFDFLRSKGYALPFMGLSVEKQVEYGWIKLKEN